jgi:3-oxoadipate enol-lactonase
MARIDPAAYRIGAQAVWLADQRERAGAVRVPTLVLCGDQDHVTPPALSRELMKLIPGAHYELVAGAGHLSNLERPQEFNTLVGAFVRGVDSHR